MFDVLKDVFKVIKSNVQNSDNQLIGRQIANSPQIEGLISDLVDEVMVFNHALQAVSDPIENCVAQAQKKIQQTGVLRGRPLYHNYLGTGAGRGPFVAASCKVLATVTISTYWPKSIVSKAKNSPVRINV